MAAQCCPAAVLAPLSQSRGGMRMHQVTEEEVAWLRTDSAASWATKLAISWTPRSKTIFQLASPRQPYSSALFKPMGLDTSQCIQTLGGKTLFPDADTSRGLTYSLYSSRSPPTYQ